jgi:hypothetical protein
MAKIVTEKSHRDKDSRQDHALQIKDSDSRGSPSALHACVECKARVRFSGIPAWSST